MGEDDPLPPILDFVQGFAVYGQLTDLEAECIPVSLRFCFYHQSHVVCNVQLCQQSSMLERGVLNEYLSMAYACASLHAGPHQPPHRIERGLLHRCASCVLKSCQCMLW